MPTKLTNAYMLSIRAYFYVPNQDQRKTNQIIIHNSSLSAPPGLFTQNEYSSTWR